MIVTWSEPLGEWDEESLDKRVGEVVRIGIRDPLRRRWFTHLGWGRVSIGSIRTTGRVRWTLNIRGPVGDYVERLFEERPGARARWTGPKDVAILWSNTTT
jgi:hypothetical protein